MQDVFYWIVYSNYLLVVPAACWKLQFAITLFYRPHCTDSTSTLVPTGGHWRTLETPPQAGASGSDCGINRAVSVETFSRPPQSDSHVQEEFSGQRQSDIRRFQVWLHRTLRVIAMPVSSIVVKSIVPLPTAMDTDMDPPTSSGYSVSDAPGLPASSLTSCATCPPLILSWVREADLDSTCDPFICLIHIL